MDVIRHNHPCQETAAAIVIVKENILHPLRDGGDRKFARTIASVAIFFQANPPLALFLNAEQWLPFLLTLLRQSVRQAKIEHLLNARDIKVRQISSCVPASKSE